jgi:hypothetical protein
MFTANLDTTLRRQDHLSVQNAFHWVHLYESPAAAHGDYMVNSAVWERIRCGATNGRVMWQ